MSLAGPCRLWLLCALFPSVNGRVCYDDSLPTPTPTHLTTVRGSSWAGSWSFQFEGVWRKRGHMQQLHWRILLHGWSGRVILLEPRECGRRDATGALRTDLRLYGSLYLSPPSRALLPSWCVLLSISWRVRGYMDREEWNGIPVEPSSH